LISSASGKRFTYQWLRVFYWTQVVLGQEETGGARVVTLNRPRQLNGISDRVVRLLCQFAYRVLFFFFR
jgi:hypothetical protein